MPIKITTGEDIEPIAEGVYDALVGNMSESERRAYQSSEMEPCIQIEFDIVTPGEALGRRAFHKFSPFLTPKSKLTKLCEAALGRAIKPEEMAEIKEAPGDIAKLIGGKTVTIIMKNKKSAQGKTYYNITDFLTSKTTPAKQPEKQEETVDPDLDISD